MTRSPRVVMGWVYEARTAAVRGSSGIRMLAIRGAPKWQRPACREQVMRSCVRVRCCAGGAGPQPFHLAAQALDLRDQGRQVRVGSLPLLLVGGLVGEQLLFQVAQRHGLLEVLASYEVCRSGRDCRPNPMGENSWSSVFSAWVERLPLAGPASCWQSCAVILRLPYPVMATPASPAIRLPADPGSGVSV